MDIKATKNFTSIRTLFIQSWDLFVSRIGRLLLFSLIAIAGFLICFFIAGISIFGSYVTFFVSHGTKAAPPSIGIAILGIVVFIIVAIVLNIVYTAWILLSLSENATESFGTVFKKGFSFIIPLFLLGFLSFFFQFGGFFFFFIPALIFALFFCFSTYEVVCDKQTPLIALKQSYMILTRNFGDIFVRWLVLIFISFAISIFPQIFIQFDRAMTFSLIMVTFLLNSVFQWFALCYIYTLYIQAKQRTDFTKPASLLWMWIIAILGWILFAFVLVGVTYTISGLVKSGQLQKWMNQYEKQKQTNSGQNPYIQNNGVYNQPTQSSSANTGSTTNTTYVYPTAAAAPTIDYNAKLQQEEQQAQAEQQQMQQQYNQQAQQNSQQFQQALQQQQQQYNSNVQNQQSQPTP